MKTKDFIKHIDDQDTILVANQYWPIEIQVEGKGTAVINDARLPDRFIGITVDGKKFKEVLSLNQ